ncbi:uncharacterized protein LOC126704593 isoform X2 [Quercus robur]|uniref:uncharacterized protein LOC126704593 isoform X2 n=1 Tax=Quercus robur TaxID=38942 RepID=UPI0021613A80|nr:uncharacterized protein LOC126704593 isoform X2 [Quercus robur]
MEVVDYEYEIGVCGHRWALEESTVPNQVEQWFAFHIPYSSSCSSPVIKVRPSLPDPFSSVKLFGVRNSHAYGGSRLYTIGGIDPTSDSKIVDPLDYNIYKLWTLKLDSGSDGGWKPLPPMNFPLRRSSCSIALDSKLYVFDGFSSEFSENCGWMEVYDPISDTWESLPSPPLPLPVPPFSVRMYAALESNQQIVVALRCDPKLSNFSTLFTYNISNRCWTKLAHHFVVHPVYPFSIYRTPVAVGNTLYWGSVYFHRGYDDIRIHAHAYDLDRDEWLIGSLNIFCRGVKSPILLEDELLVDKAHTPPLLHLADQKFCIFLHSTNRKHTFHHNKEGIKHDYLNCLILEISPPPIFDHDKDKDNSTDLDHLCISIVSIHKFPFHDELWFHDSLLLYQDC